MATKELVSITKTKNFFKHALDIKLTSEEARVATDRIVELFQLLDKWDKEHLLPPCIAYWLLDREMDFHCK
ncbi:MAG: hypothetical protein KAH31_05185 [Candidatus Sabulitectum sp.]|nr:hypothetical protein [Candidatus Sabulitectum sp.]